MPAAAKSTKKVPAVRALTPRQAKLARARVLADHRAKRRKFALTGRD